MNKIIILGIVFVVIIVGVVLGSGKESDRSESLVATSPPLTGSDPVTTGAATGTPRYAEFSPSVLVGSANTRRVLFFYASWCETCRPADADFRASIDKIPTDVTVIRVNYNDPDTDQSEKDLAKKYAVTYQHTFVQIDEKGDQVAIWNGGKTRELLENLKGNLGIEVTPAQ